MYLKYFSSLLNESFECIVKMKWILIRQLRHDFRICKSVLQQRSPPSPLPSATFTNTTYSHIPYVYSFLYTKHSHSDLYSFACRQFNERLVAAVLTHLVCVFMFFFCAPQSFYLIKATKCWKNRIYPHTQTHSYNARLPKTTTDNQ